MRTTNALIIVVLALLVTAAGVSFAKDSGYEPKDPARFFGYEKTDFEVKQELVETGEKYDLLRVTFPAYHPDPSNPQVVAWYYRQKTAAPKPGIVVLPILGGDYGPSKIFADHYAKSGFHVLRFERKAELFIPAEGLNRTRKVLVDTVVDVRRGLDWWLMRSRVDETKVGVSGISMGGFVGSLVLASDPRIHAGTLMLNGCDWAKLIVITEEGYIAKCRTEFKHLNGWDDETLYDKAKEALGDVEPCSFAHRLDPKQVMIFSALFDHIVPYENATMLWEAGGHLKRATLPTGHYTSAFFITHILKRCVDHYQSIWNLD